MEGPEALFSMPGLLCRADSLEGCGLGQSCYRLSGCCWQELRICPPAAGQGGAGLGLEGHGGSLRGWTLLLPPSMMYPGFGVYLVWPQEK